MSARRRNTPEREALLLKAAFEGGRQARCVVEPDGRLVLANRVARELFKSGWGVTVRDDRICALDAPTQHRLAEFLAAPQRRRRACALVAESPEHDGKLVICVLEPVRGADLWCVGLWRPHEKARRAAVAAIKDHHGLTPSQTNVVGELVAGRSVKEIADHLGIGVETVRTHLRAIYLKMGVNSQAGVVAAFLKYFLA